MFWSINSRYWRCLSSLFHVKVLFCFICLCRLLLLLFSLLFVISNWRGSVHVHPVIVLVCCGKILYSCLLVLLMYLSNYNLFLFIFFDIFGFCFIVIKIITQCWLLFPIFLTFFTCWLNCLICLHIVANIMEFHTELYLATKKKTCITMSEPSQEYDSCFPFVWCLSFLFCHLITDSPFCIFLGVRYFCYLIFVRIKNISYPQLTFSFGNVLKTNCKWDNLPTEIKKTRM